MPSSLTTLLPPALGSSPHPPVSVYGTGPCYTIAAFLDRKGPQLHYFISLRITPSSHAGRIFQPCDYFACTGLSIPGSASLPIFLPSSYVSSGFRVSITISYLFHPYFTPFMVSEILFLAKSTLKIFTSTISPTLTASSGCLIYLSVIWEMCTRPEMSSPRSMNAP